MAIEEKWSARPSPDQSSRSAAVRRYGAADSGNCVLQLACNWKSLADALRFTSENLRHTAVVLLAATHSGSARHTPVQRYCGCVSLAAPSIQREIFVGRVGQAAASLLAILFATSSDPVVVVRPSC